MIDLRSELRTRAPRNGAFHTIAVDGRGGSGKSVLAALLQELLPGFLVLNGDDYFEPTPGELAWGDFNEERFDRDVLQPLRHGADFTYRPYDWDAEPPVSERRLSAAGGFCLERCFSFALGLDWDLRLWVETPREVCLQRALAREYLPRERVLAVWETLWQPTEDEYIGRLAPLQAADFVVDGTRPFELQIRA